MSQIALNVALAAIFMAVAQVVVWAWYRYRGREPALLQWRLVVVEAFAAAIVAGWISTGRPRLVPALTIVVLTLAYIGIPYGLVRLVMKLSRREGS